MNTGVIRKTSGQGFVNVPSKGDTWVVVMLHKGGAETDWYRSDDRAKALDVLSKSRIRYPERRWRFDRLIRCKDVERDKGLDVGHTGGQPSPRT